MYDEIDDKCPPSYYYDTICAIKNSNARFKLVKEAQSLLKAKSNQTELIDKNNKRVLEGDTSSSSSIDHLDIDKIESILENISNLNVKEKAVLKSKMSSRDFFQKL